MERVEGARKVEERENLPKPESLGETLKVRSL